MSIPDELRNIRDHLRSGRFGQREVWERQLEQAADEIARLRTIAGHEVVMKALENEAEIKRLISERNDYEAEGRRHIKTIAQLRYDNEQLKQQIATLRELRELESKP